MAMKRNAWLFSSAKNIQIQTDISQLITDGKGNVRPFAAFKKDVLKTNKDYNQTYLQAEYQTALASSQSAAKWQDIQRRKERYPNLIYKTVGDNNVREAHVALDGICRPVDHDFWKSFYPPNGWRCRCYVQQTNRPTNGDTVPTVDDKNVPPMFRDNLALKGDILPAGHPYFKNLEKSLPQRAVITDEVIKEVPYELVYSLENGSRILVHPFTHDGDFKVNIFTALRLAKEKKREVKLRHHLNSGKNPEFEIDGLIADLKTPKTKVNNVIAKAFEQGCKFIIFEAGDYIFERKTLVSHIYGNFISRLKNKSMPKDFKGFVVLYRTEEKEYLWK
jgi:SPP1 gp7 family putative phage head morphogenesis protein